ncbi:MAG: chromate efflux transporter [Nitrospirae bacterium]|nr:chromate efflux transporter [Nitrospirota bacterium]MCL5976784.1 chromate efflux transporter [Nitrospirota bacterium]
MIAYIREMSVKRKKWLDDKTFNDGVALCQSIPGATAIQIAAYVGLRSRGIRGALLSYAGFGLPAFILMLILSSLYARYHEVPGIISLFNGLQVSVVAIVAHATYSFGKSTFENYRHIILAVASAVLFWAGISPFIVILGAAFAGIAFHGGKGISIAPTAEREPDGRNVKRLSMLFLILLLGLLAFYIADKRLFNLAALMMKIDLFAFGGGFASLPLMLHEIVTVRGWIDHKTFMDGIALGQVTPGPIVITATFVGYMLHGLSGALAATLGMFTPSFLILIIVTPVFDKFKASAYFSGATKGICVSFVGLLFFVAIKFSSAVPWDIIRVLLFAGGFVALFKKIDILYVVVITAVISLFLF